MADVGGATSLSASSKGLLQLKSKEGRGLLGARKENRSVLVVDDLYFNRMILGKLLASFGFAVSYSRDGQEAVDEFERRKKTKEELYAILMDVNMPTMDGLMATKRIRSIEAASTPHTDSAAEPCGSSSSASTTEQSAVLTSLSGRRVPIVGISASSSADQLKSAALQGMQLDLATEQPWAAVGMDHFMEKPVNRDKLQHMLDLLEHNYWRGGGSRPGSQAAVNSRSSEQPAQELQHVDMLESQRCDSLGSFSSGVDIKVCSRPGGQQVAKRSLGGTMDLAEQACTGRRFKRAKSGNKLAALAPAPPSAPDCPGTPGAA